MAVDVKLLAQAPRKKIVREMAVTSLRRSTPVHPRPDAISLQGSRV